MQNAINIIATVIVSMGGMAGFILGISTYIGNILAKKIEEKYKNKMDKELEEYKGKINERLNKLDKIEEKALYIAKMNYDSEYKIYMEIWPKLNECITKTFKLYPMGIENVPIDKEELQKYKEKKYKEFCEKYDQYIHCIDQYAPFYKEEFYNDLNEIKTECSIIGNKFFMYEMEVRYSESFRACRDLSMTGKDYEEVKEKQENIKKVKNELLNKIRKYLNELKLE